jgi:uncharacterized membrane protein
MDSGSRTGNRSRDCQPIVLSCRVGLVAAGTQLNRPGDDHTAMSDRPSAPLRSRELRAGVTPLALLAGGIFGFGFSGLIDTLLLHLVFQWHHLLSGVYRTDTLDGLRTNVLADGLFSIAMLVIMGIGAGLLWRAERRTDIPLAIRPIAGAAVLGLGAFDLYDALVDHALLGLHQPLSQGGRYNPHWIVVSVLVLLAGAYLYRTGTRPGHEDST